MGEARDKLVMFMDKHKSVYRQVWGDGVLIWNDWVFRMLNEDLFWLGRYSVFNSRSVIPNVVVGSKPYPEYQWWLLFGSPKKAKEILFQQIFENKIS